MSQKVTRQLGNMLIEIQMGNAIMKKEKKTYNAGVHTSDTFLFKTMAVMLPGDSCLIPNKERANVSYYSNKRIDDKHFYMINCVDGTKRFGKDDIRLYCINKQVEPRTEFAKERFEDYTTRENFNVEEKLNEQAELMKVRTDSKYYKIEHDVPLRSYRNMVKNFLKTLIAGQFFEIGIKDNALYKEVAKDLLKEEVLVTVKYKSSDKMLPMKDKKFIVHKYQWDAEEGNRILKNLANRAELNRQLHADGKMKGGGRWKKNLQNKPE